MREIFPGVVHWTARNENIGERVSSYFVAPARMAIDPMVPDEGLDAFERECGRPDLVVLTIGHHHRHAQEFADRFGCPIAVSEEGAERLGSKLATTTHRDGDEIAPGVRAIKVGVLCEDEYALHITATAQPALSMADSLIRYGDTPHFVPDHLLGEDPERVKAGLKRRFAELADELAIEHLLLAHGEPVVGGGREALREAGR